MKKTSFLFFYNVLFLQNKRTSNYYHLFTIISITIITFISNLNCISIFLLHLFTLQTPIFM